MFHCSQVMVPENASTAASHAASRQLVNAAALPRRERAPKHSSPSAANASSQ